MTTRRTFLQQTAGTALGLRAAAAYATPSRTAAASFVDLLRPPDSVLVQTAAGDQRLVVASASRWTWSGGELTTTPTPTALRVSLTAASTGVRRIALRWRGDLTTVRLILGDAWERGYGDLEWRAFVPDRVLPWYAATWDGALTHAYGVRTSPRAFCFWQIDDAGVTLWADVRSGAAPLELGTRTLDVCDVVCRTGRKGESPFTALRALCTTMCAAPRVMREPVYGSNDWYYAYGKNSSDTIRADAEHIVELSPPGTNRPFVVIDDGWQPGRGATRAGTGTWERGNEKFSDIPALFADIRRIGARPGIWVRPLQSPTDAPDSWRLARDRNMLDPTVPAVREKIAADIARIHAWGAAIIKHDYTTFDVFGRWGNQMASTLTRDGWTFAEGPRRTTAEVIDELYRTIRTAAGDTAIIGCNTVSHLSAGHFEMCRIGDDTSGTEWARTRKMGVNTLAFRAVQHGTFYTADADCVGVTNAVPWEMNRKWLDLLARSGTMLFVSLAPDALGADQRRDLKTALAFAARPQPLGEPLDWQRTTWPSRWRLGGKELSFDWGPADG